MLRNEKGFTLLEIIASLAILAVGILTLVQLFSGSMNQAAQADRYLNGVYLAQQKFSQLEMDGFKAEDNEGTFEDETYSWQLEILPYESSLNSEDARIELQKVSLRVYWEDKNQEKEVQLVSLNILGETHTAPASLLDLSSQTTANAPKAAEQPKIKNLNPSESK